MQLKACQIVAAAKRFAANVLPPSTDDRSAHPDVLRDGFSLTSTEGVRTLPQSRGNHSSYPELLRIGFSCNNTEGVFAPCPTQVGCAGSLIQARGTTQTDCPRLALTRHSPNQPTCPNTRSAILPLRDFTSISIHPRETDFIPGHFRS